jgi:hypothetical protein
MGRILMAAILVLATPGVLHAESAEPNEAAESEPELPRLSLALLNMPKVREACQRFEQRELEIELAGLTPPPDLENSKEDRQRCWSRAASVYRIVQDGLWKQVEGC